MKSAARWGRTRCQCPVGIVPGVPLAPVRLDLWYNQTARCVMTEGANRVVADATARHAGLWWHRRGAWTSARRTSAHMNRSPAYQSDSSDDNDCVRVTPAYVGPSEGSIAVNCRRGRTGWLSDQMALITMLHSAEELFSSNRMSFVNHLWQLREVFHVL